MQIKPSMPWLGLAAAALLLTACSTPNYAEQAASFSRSVSAGGSAFGALRAAERDAAIREQVSMIIAARHAVNIDCDVVTDLAGAIDGPALEAEWRALSTELAGGQPCALEHFGFATGGQEQGVAVFEVVPLADGTIEVSSQARNSAALLGAIDDYGEALAAVAGAEDIAALNESGGRLALAVGGLAGTLGKAAGGPDLSGLVDPASAAVQWIGTNYLNHKRRKMLLRAAGAADALMDETEDRLGALTLALQVSGLQHKMVVLDNDITEHFQRTLAASARDGDTADNRTRRETLLHRIVEGYLGLVALKTSEPAETVKAMRAAHAALLMAIQDDRSLKTAFQELRTFAEIVKELHEKIGALH